MHHRTGAKNELEIRDEVQEQKKTFKKVKYERVQPLQHNSCLLHLHQLKSMTLMWGIFAKMPYSGFIGKTG
ncbi:hypothetical protein J6590_102920 [Homalodisca vitripennis]|nr:hypothetical protein J6590_102920 [Homalodisca vitripennis]